VGRFSWAPLFSPAGRDGGPRPCGPLAPLLLALLRPFSSCCEGDFRWWRSGAPRRNQPYLLEDGAFDCILVSDVSLRVYRQSEDDTQQLDIKL
jgi:hypothetical protein